MHVRDEGEEASAYSRWCSHSDYVHKCGFQKVVLGLSGGIDSALTACIAVDALGRENVSEWACRVRTRRKEASMTRRVGPHLGTQFEKFPLAIFLTPICVNSNPHSLGANLTSRRKYSSSHSGLVDDGHVQ